MADTTQPSFGQGLDNLGKDLRKENDTLKDLNARLQESLVTKDACIIKLNEKIRNLESKIYSGAKEHSYFNKRELNGVL